MDLKEWTKEYIKARNAMQRNLLSCVEQDDRIECEYKQNKKSFIVSSKLFLPQIDFPCTVVCENTSENLNYLLNNWELFSHPHLSIFFVNTHFHQFWQIHPYMHSKIADPLTLEQGIRTMAFEVSTV